MLSTGRSSRALKGVESSSLIEHRTRRARLMSDADVKLDVGRDSTRGLGAGGNPEVGRRACR